MNTKNTKTTVIILLITANIFFIYNITALKISSENIPSEMIDDAVSILARNGFAADRNKIPERKPANVVYEGVYSEAAMADILKGFAGIPDELRYLELRDLEEMIVPGGTSYAAGDYRFVFLENYFNVSIADKDYISGEELEGINEEVQEGIRLLLESGISKTQDGDTRKIERAVRDFIRKPQNKDIKLSFEVIEFGENKSENLEFAWINQTADGVMIDSHIAYVEISDGRVKYFSGRWYFGELTPRRGTPLLDSVNILFKSMESDGNIIQGDDMLKGMETEYSVITHEKTSEMESFYFVPSWRLVFESGRNFSYNMITGNKN